MKKTGGIFEIEEDKEKLSKLDVIVQKDDFWQKSDSAEQLKKYNKIKDHIKNWEKLQQNIKDIDELFQMSIEENETETWSLQSWYSCFDSLYYSF